MRFVRFIPVIAATLAVVACFVSTPIKQSIQDQKKEEKTVSDPPFLPQKGQQDEPLGSPNLVADVPSATTDIPLIAVDNPAVASASVSTTENLGIDNVLGAVDVTLQDGQQAIVSLRVQSLPASDDIEVVRIGATTSASGSRSIQSEEITPLVYIKTGVKVVIDRAKFVILFPVKFSGAYIVHHAEKPPRDDAQFPTYAERQSAEWLAYNPVKNEFASPGQAQPSTYVDDPIWMSVLDASDIASLSIDAAHGDAAEKDPRKYYNFKKFFYFAFNLSKQRERVWKEFAPRVFTYDTRNGMDVNGELMLYNPTHSVVGLGDSMGGLVLRSRRAFWAKNVKAKTGYAEFPKFYLGDLTWGTGHHGLMFSHMKWARAGFKCFGDECNRYGATQKIIVHAALWHNFGPSMFVSPNKDILAPIRQLGYDLLSFGHRSFFPSGKGDLYPNPAFIFSAWYAFGPFKDANLADESISAQDRYGVPCGATAKSLEDSVQAVSVTVKGECKYNLAEALEYLEDSLKISKRRSFIVYAGYFDNLEELFFQHALFDRIVNIDVERIIEAKDRGNAVFVRQALMWSQVEQGWFFPSPSKDKQLGEGLANLSAALKLKPMDRPILVRHGVSIEPDMAAIEARKADDVIAMRVVKGISHADFVADDTDEFTTFTPRVHDLYEQTIADLFWLKDSADSDPGSLLSNELTLQGGLRHKFERPLRYPFSAQYVQLRFEQDKTDNRRVTAYYKVRYRDILLNDLFRIEYYSTLLRWWNGRWWFWEKEPNPYYVQTGSYLRD